MSEATANQPDACADRLPPGIRVFERGWLSANNVLLIDGDDTVLVDTGYVSHAQQTVALVEAALDGKPLKRLIKLRADVMVVSTFLERLGGPFRRWSARMLFTEFDRGYDMAVGYLLAHEELLHELRCPDALRKALLKAALKPNARP